MPITKNCSVGEMYIKIKEMRASEIKHIKTSSEMKERCQLLSRLNSELRLWWHLEK